MKSLIKFYNQNPSYLKVGVEKTAKKANVSANTVAKFRTTFEYRAMKNQYLEVIKNRKATKTAAK